MERVVSCPIYNSDLVKVKAFKERKGIKKLADAVRICVEFSDSHGALK